MKNLAGDKQCDQHIALELERCRINIHKMNRLGKSEVPWTIYGTLGRFTFERAWYYYVVKGELPLNIAQELYADPVGKTDIRVAGHCGCPAPEEWATYYDRLRCWSDAKILLDFKQKEEFEQCLKSDSQWVRQVGEDGLKNFRFVEDPKAVGFGYVELYHIDSEIGLRLFADTLRKHSLC
jgi:hypothetical protein